MMARTFKMDPSTSDERIFRALVENSDELTIITDSNGIVVFVSPQCETVTGYPGERFMGRAFPDIIHPDDVESCQAAWVEVVHSKKPIRNLEYRIIDGEGRVRWISHTAGSLVMDGNIVGMQNNIREITSRKNTELNLRESQQFNEMILNASPDVIYIYDIEKKENVYSNDGIMRVLGFTASEIKAFGDSLIERLMHPEDFEVYIRSILPKYQTVSDGEFIEHEYRMKHKDGRM